MGMDENDKSTIENDTENVESTEETPEQADELSNSAINLIGNYHHTLDAKGRVFLPAQFRKVVGDTVFMTKGTDGCIFAFAEKVWINFANKVSSKPISKGAMTQRSFLGSAYRSDLDPQGRIMIASNLREFAELKKDVVVIGTMKRIEIWDADKWAEYEAANDANLLEALDELGI